MNFTVAKLRVRKVSTVPSLHSCPQFDAQHARHCNVALECQSVSALVYIKDNLGPKVGLCTLLALVVTSLFVASQVSKIGSLLLFLCLWSAFVLCATFTLVKVRRHTVYGDMRPKVAFVGLGVCFSVALAIEACTLFGTHAGYFAWMPLSSLVRTSLFRFVFWFCGISSCILLFLTFAKCTLGGYVRMLAGRIHDAVTKKTLRDSVCVLAIGVMFAIAAKFVLSLSLGVSFCFGVALCISLAYVVQCIKRKKTTVSGLFLAFSLPWALFLAVCMPAISGLSWDDQIHYTNVQNLSYVLNAPGSLAEASLYDPLLGDPDVNNPQPYVQGLDHVSSDAIRDYEWRINALYPASDLISIRAGVGSALGLYNSIGYLPSAAALWLGRLLHLPLLYIYVMGRCANALFYIFVSYVAIRVIPCKKLLLCVIALLPSSIFLSANYSYDPWVICLVYLLVALLVKAMVGSDAVVGLWQCAFMLFVGFVAMGPKAIYFPVLALLLFVPRRKFVSGQACILFRYCVVLTALVALSSFAAPFLLTGGESYTDSRGAEGVSSSGQLSHILADPFGYLGLLFGFLFGDYISPTSFDGLSYNFAYMGNISSVAPWLGCVTLFVIVVVACTDSGFVSNRLSRASHGAFIIAVFVLICMLMATALYIAFTPVGLSTIHGMQPRYLTPLVFPLALFALNPKVINVSARWRGNIAAVLIMSVPLVMSCACYVWLFITS